MKRIGLTLGLMLCAALVVYPLLSNYLYEKKSDNVLTEYREKIREEKPDFSAEWERCAAYNEALLAVSAGFAGRNRQPAAAEYTERLSSEEAMCYLYIPKLGQHFAVYHGTGESLEKGVGHLRESSLPVGGPGTHAVLTGHSGVSSKVLFSDLHRLEVGDSFWLYVLDEAHCYTVREVQTVLPYETDALAIRPGEDLVTLITCTPFGVNSHRLLVTGERDLEKEAALSASDAEAALPEPEVSLADSGASPWRQSYQKALAIGLAGGVALFGLIFLCDRLRRRRKNSRTDQTDGSIIGKEIP